VLLLAFTVIVTFVLVWETAVFLIEGELTRSDLPQFLVRAAPPMLLLAIQASVFLLALLVAIIGPIIWFIDRRPRRKADSE